VGWNLSNSERCHNFASPEDQNTRVVISRISAVSTPTNMSDSDSVASQGRKQRVSRLSASEGSPHYSRSGRSMVNILCYLYLNTLLINCSCFYLKGCESLAKLPWKQLKPLQLQLLKIKQLLFVLVVAEVGVEANSQIRGRGLAVAGWRVGGLLVGGLLVCWLEVCWLEG